MKNQENGREVDDSLLILVWLVERAMRASVGPSFMETQASKGPERNLTKQLTLLLVLGCIALGTYAALRDPKPAPSASIPAPREPVSSASADAAGVHGRVLEVIQVTAYTYLRLARGTEDVWAAVSKAEVAPGTDVQVSGALLMTNFTSKELGRTFSSIYFGHLASGPATERPSGHPNFNGDAAPAVPVAASKKAEGGYQVSEIYEKRAALSGKKVRVRGTVVRVTENVMGTNFVHLRDGSGSAEAENHDLVLKVAESPPSAGQEALFEGTAQSDVNLGADYSYKVLVADAVVIVK